MRCLSLTLCATEEAHAFPLHLKPTLTAETKALQLPLSAAHEQ